MTIIFFKRVFKFIACFPSYINKTEAASTFGRNSLVVQDKLIQFLNLLVTRSVNPLYFLFKFLNALNTHKIAGNYSITVTNLLHYNQAKPFRCLILKVIGYTVNMMV